MTVWLITGANRGLGKALLDRVLARGDTVIAAVRNVESLSDTKAVVVQYDAASETSAKRMAEELKTKHKITSIDVVVANAGMQQNVVPIAQITPADFDLVYRVHTLAPILLFQAVLPFLQDNAKFIYVSTGAATIGLQDKIPFVMGNYGSSKCAANWIVRKMHLEHENLIIFPVHPGTLNTDMGAAAVKAMGRPESVLAPLDPAADRLVALIDKATRERNGGRFMDSWAQELGEGVDEWPW